MQLLLDVLNFTGIYPEKVTLPSRVTLAYLGYPV